MTRQRLVGILIFVLCIVGFFVYAYLLMLSEWSPVVLQLSVLMAVGGILGVISWIGYNMATSKTSSSSSMVSDDKK
ncbi:MAG: transcriptional regulator [Nitrososphaerota archaeon]